MWEPLPKLALPAATRLMKANDRTMGLPGTATVMCAPGLGSPHGNLRLDYCRVWLVVTRFYAAWKIRQAYTVCAAFSAGLARLCWSFARAYCRSMKVLMKPEEKLAAEAQLR